jgi:hypothetical protein
LKEVTWNLQLVVNGMVTLLVYIGRILRSIHHSHYALPRKEKLMGLLQVFRGLENKYLAVSQRQTAIKSGL